MDPLSPEKNGFVKMSSKLRSPPPRFRVRMTIWPLFPKGQKAQKMLEVYVALSATVNVMRVT